MYSIGTAVMVSGDKWPTVAETTASSYHTVMSRINAMFFNHNKLSKIYHCA